MNVKLRVLTAGVLFFTGQLVMAQKDSLKVEDIDEVIVVGFGQKKTVQEMTGSISTMSSKSIQDVPVASVDKMLQGRVAGVQTGSASGQPGGFSNVRVRGISSINGVTTPIYIVDGVRVANGDLTTNNTTANILANMNPDDIESVTVLKDAVSTAVYGADAGAGVIVITTKSGKKGKPRFNLSFNTGFNQQAVDPHRGFTAGEYKEYLKDGLNNAINKDYSVADYAAGILANHTNSASLLSNVATIFKSDYDTNWADIVRKDGYQQNADFSMSGGNDKFTYYASANMFDQNSIVKNSFFKRLSYTTKLGYQATEKLKISTDFQISHGKTRTLGEGGGFANPMLAQYFNRPTDPARNPDGTWYYSAANSRLSNNMFNPGYILENNYNQAGTLRAFANFSAEYKILDNLTYRFIFAPEYINVEEDTYWNPTHGDGYAYGGYQRTSANRYFNFNILTSHGVCSSTCRWRDHQTETFFCTVGNVAGIGQLGCGTVSCRVFFKDLNRPTIWDIWNSNNVIVWNIAGILDGYIKYCCCGGCGRYTANGSVCTCTCTQFCAS